MTSPAAELHKSDPSQSYCMGMVRSPWNHLAWATACVALLVIGILASTGVLNAMGTSNATYLSYGMYAGAAAILIVSCLLSWVGRHASRIAYTQKPVTTGRPTPDQTSQKTQTHPVIPDQTSQKTQTHPVTPDQTSQKTQTRPVIPDQKSQKTQTHPITKEQVRRIRDISSQLAEKASSRVSNHFAPFVETATGHPLFCRKPTSFLKSDGNITEVIRLMPLGYRSTSDLQLLQEIIEAVVLKNELPTWVKQYIKE